ncbi:MAG: cytochrome c oxidase subunit II [Chloroflexota bacterium]
MGAPARLRLLRTVTLAAPVLALASACRVAGPLSTLTDRGEVSKRINDLFFPVFWVAVAIFVVVEGLLLFAVLRFRQRPGREALPQQVHGNTRLEVGWTILPSLILAVIAIPTISTIVDLSRKPDNPLEVRVIAHQWWWEFQYRDPSAPNKQVYVANEMHIPVGRKIYATVESVDVIHSFWIPNLAGKMDAIPGKQNHIWFSVKQPGVYQGQCAEFCGDSHALMRFVVIAQPESEFNQWLQGQAQQARTPTGGSAARGFEVFMGNACIACHAIEGTNAQGRIAPNLTHFGSRLTLGANRLENTPENVVRWIKNPQAVKPGAKMPAWQGVLSEDDIKAIADYLESLK